MEATPIRRPLPPLLLALSLTLATGPSMAAEAEGDLGILAMPIAAFDTDDGLGGGARVELAFRDPDCEPYRVGLMAQGFVTLRGYHNHELRYDHLGLGPKGRSRLTVYAAWRQWLNDGYWGIGNDAVREAAYAKDFDTDDIRRKRYRYTLIQPLGRATLRHDLADGSPWSVFGALEPKHTQVRSYQGSLLEEQRPYGMAGGLAIQASGGMLHDTRDKEIAPGQGALLEASGRLSPALQGEAGGFGGVQASARGFRTLGGRVVLAGRVAGEWLWGEVPFYEMINWAGARPVKGVGGGETARGLSYGRYRAPGKAIANAEARVAAFEFPLLKKPLLVELCPFVDAVTVFAAGDQATPGVRNLPLHPAAGIGIHAIWDRSFVGRLDLGWGLDPVVDEEGAVTQEPTLGIYMLFDHAFYTSSSSTSSARAMISW